MNSEYKPNLTENHSKNGTFEFAEFSFDLKEKILRRGKAAISMPPKTCELLAVLLENYGKLLTKEELFKQVWADTFVEDANLSHHIAVLRKTLGENKNGAKFIETVTRRGYRFVAPVREINSAELMEFTVKESSLTRTIISAETEFDDQESAVKIENLLSESKTGALHRKMSGLRRIIFGAAFIIAAAAIGFMVYNLASPKNEAKKSFVPLEITRVSDKSVSISVISPDGKLLAYAQNPNVADGGSLYVRQLDTNREIKLLEPDGGRTFADMKFSFDGNFVYFISFEKDAKKGAIYRIPFLGGTRQKIIELTANDTSFAVSPDNKQIAFFRFANDGGSLVAAPLDNPAGEEKVLLNFKYSENNFGGFLSWSPDGRFIALTNNPTPSAPDVKVYGFDVQKEELKTFSDEVFENIGKHVFSSDGREIYFIGDRKNTAQNFFAIDTANGGFRTLPLEATSNSFYSFYGLSMTADGKTLTADLIETRADIWRIPSNGEMTGAKRIKRGDNDGKRGIAALPNGYLLYTAFANGKTDIWKMREDGADIQPLTNDAFAERNLTATRDGRFLVYASDAGGGSHLFRLNLNEPGEIKQLTFGEAVDRQPDISPDGQWIVYISEEKEKSIIKKIPFDGGEPIVLNDSENSVRPAFSPDGKQIAFEILSPVRSQPGTIAIISADGGRLEKTYAVAGFSFRDSTAPMHWTPDGSGIIFRKSNTSISNLWRLDLKTGTAAPLTAFSDEEIYNHVFSADGKNIYFSRGLAQTNSVLIRNF